MGKLNLSNLDKKIPLWIVGCKKCIASLTSSGFRTFLIISLAFVAGVVAHSVPLNRKTEIKKEKSSQVAWQTHRQRWCFMYCIQLSAIEIGPFTMA